MGNKKREAPGALLSGVVCRTLDPDHLDDHVPFGIDDYDLVTDRHIFEAAIGRHDADDFRRQIVKSDAAWDCRPDRDGKVHVLHPVHVDVTEALPNLSPLFGGHTGASNCTRRMTGSALLVLAGRLLLTGWLLAFRTARRLLTFRAAPRLLPFRAASGFFLTTLALLSARWRLAGLAALALLPLGGATASRAAWAHSAATTCTSAGAAYAPRITGGATCAAAGALGNRECSPKRKGRHGDRTEQWFLHSHLS
jgi:hypothetical protein